MYSSKSIYKIVALLFALGIASSFFIAIMNGQQIQATENSSGTIDGVQTDGYLAYSIYLTLSGNNQGNIDGDVDIQGKRGTIEVLGFSHQIVLPTDPNSGQIAGSRKHYPIRINKPIDSSSPKLIKAFVEMEDLQAIFKFYRVNSTNHEEHYYTIQLEDATIISIQEQGSLTSHSEAVSFIYRQITWTWVDGGVTYSDQWAIAGGS